jgi:uncharacterized phage protein (TIGR02216 family)
MNGIGRRFPWARMMALGIGALRLAPRDFWASTPREMWAAFPSLAASAAPSRDDLQDLMNRYPDEPKAEHD